MCCITNIPDQILYYKSRVMLSNENYGIFRNGTMEWNNFPSLHGMKGRIKTWNEATKEHVTLKNVLIDRPLNPGVCMMTCFFF